MCCACGRTMSERPNPAVRTDCCATKPRSVGNFDVRPATLAVSPAPTFIPRPCLHRQAVYEQTERTVRENRARGASECDSWAAIGKIVVNQ